MYTQATLQAALQRRDMLRAVIGLGTTQIIGWGTTFSTLAIFGTPIGDALGLTREVVFGGITVMLLVSAMLAPRVGKVVDRLGAQRVMIVGSFVAAAAMLVQAHAVGLASYMAGWVLVGIATPMMLNNTSVPGLVQVVGPNARRAITGLMLLSGLTGTIFIPLNAWLLKTIGWREAYMLFAVLHVVICAPLHWWVLKRRNSPYADVSGGPKKHPATDGLLPPEMRRRAFILLATWSCTEGFLTWGLYIQVIDIFQAMGLTQAAAVGVWALVGPSQATARFVELMLGARYSILSTAMGSALMTSTSFLAFVFLGVSFWPAVLFCLLMGLGHGLFAVARNTLPLALFGAREFGSYMGLLMVPQNIVNAVAPIAFAFIIARLSPVGGLWAAGISAAMGCVAVLFLINFCRKAVAEAGRIEP
ncbi:MAG: MFS transporter [Hyphomicrobiaceae bacterium]